MRTSNPRPSAPQWLLLDAQGQMLGVVAAKAASLLRGKHKVTFSPNALHGDHVVIVNAAQIAVRPKKARNKLYHRHTPYLGHMQTTTLEHLLQKKPTEPIEKAISGMLPKNRLRKEMMKRLHVFAAAEHPFEAQKPSAVILGS